jgi:hypothetical protein
MCIPWSPSFDLILSGGIEEGSFVGVAGLPKYGKTFSILSFCVNAQKPEYGSRPIYYGKVEGRLSTEHLRGIRGLNLKQPHFNIIQSTEERILSAQDFLKIFEMILRTVPGAVLIIDSISTLCDEREQTNGVGTETRGGGAKLFSQFTRLVNQIVPVKRSIVFGVSHLISNTSGTGASQVEKSAVAWKHQKDYDLKVVSRAPWKDNKEKQIGLEMKWECKTSKNGNPGLTTNSYLRFGLGLDHLWELIIIATAVSIIKKSGAWLQLPFATAEKGKPTQFQGTDKLYQALLRREDWQAEIRNRITKMVSGETEPEVEVGE